MSKEEYISTLNDLQDQLNRANIAPEAKVKARGIIRDIYSQIESEDPNAIVSGFSKELMERPNVISDKETLADANNAVDFYKKNRQLARDLAFSTSDDYEKAHEAFGSKPYTPKQMAQAVQNLRNIHVQEEAANLYRKHYEPTRALLGIGEDYNKQSEAISKVEDELAKNYSPAEAKAIRDAVLARVHSKAVGQMSAPTEQTGVRNAFLAGIARGEQGFRAGLSTIFEPSIAIEEGKLIPDKRKVEEEKKIAKENITLKDQIEKLRSTQKSGFIGENIIKPVAEMLPDLVMAVSAGPVTMYAQGVGSIYNPMVESGIDPTTAKGVSVFAGIPYAILSKLEIEKIAPVSKLSPITSDAINKTIFNRMAQFGATTEGRIVAEGLGEAAAKGLGKLGVATGYEASIEAAQKAVEDIGYEVARLINDDPNVKALGLGDITRDVANEFAQSILPMGTLLLPRKAAQVWGYRRGTEVSPESVGLQPQQRIYQTPETEGGEFREVTSDKKITTPEFQEKRPDGVVDWKQIIGGKKQFTPMGETGDPFIGQQIAGLQEANRREAQRQAEEANRRYIAERGDIALERQAEEWQERNIPIGAITDSTQTPEYLTEQARIQEKKRREEFELNKEISPEEQQYNIIKESLAKQFPSDRYSRIMESSPERGLESNLKDEDLIVDKYTGNTIPVGLINNPKFTDRIKSQLIDMLENETNFKNKEDQVLAEKLTGLRAVTKDEARLKELAAKVLPELEFGDSVNLVVRDSDIPTDATRSIAKDNIPLAAFARVDGKPVVYINVSKLGDNISAIRAELKKRIAHEVKLHFGMSEMFTKPDDYLNAMSKIDKSMSGHTEWQAMLMSKAQDYGMDIQNPQQKAKVIEEALADYAERNTLLSRKVINLIKDVLEKIFKVSFSDSEIRDVLKRSAQAAKAGANKLTIDTKVPVGDKVMYKRTDNRQVLGRDDKYTQEIKQWAETREAKRIEEEKAKAKQIYNLDPRAATERAMNGDIDSLYGDSQFIVSEIRRMAFEDAVAQGRVEDAIRINMDFVMQNSRAGQTLRAAQASGIPLYEQKRRALKNGFFGESSKNLKKLSKVKDKDEYLRKREAIVKEIAKKQEQIKKDLAKAGLPTDIDKMTKQQLEDSTLVAKMAKIINSNNADWVAKALEWRRNAMLSAPITQSRNIASTVANIGQKTILEDLTKAAVVHPMLKVYDAIFHTDYAKTQPDIKTYIYTLAALTNNMKDIQNRSWDLARKAWVEEKPQLTTEDPDIKDTNVAIRGIKGEVIRAPQRAMLSMDEYMTNFVFSTELYGEAAVTARNEGLKIGSPEFNKRVDQIVGQGRNSPEGQRALQTALEATFKAKPGDFANMIISAREQGSWGTRLAIGTMFPFVTTPMNIYKQALAKIPGFGLLVPFAKGKDLTINDSVKALVDQGLGIGLGYVLMSALSGDSEDGEPLITGNTPVTKAGKLEAKTYEPFTIKIGDKRLSYKYIEPLATVLGSLTDMSREYKSMAREGKDIGKSVGDMAQGLMNSLSDKTFLAQLGDVVNVVDAYREGQAVAGFNRLATNWSSSWIVPNLIKQPLRAADEKIREMKAVSPGGALMYSIMPIDYLAPPPKVDIWGQDVKKADLETPAQMSDFWWRVTVPVDLQNKKSIDNYTRAIVNWNNQNPNDPYVPGDLNTTITRQGEQRKVTPEQFNKYAKLAGRYAKDIMDGEYISSYSHPDEDDIKTIRKALSAGRKQAADEMWDSLEVKKKSRTLKEVIEENVKM